MNVVCAEMEEKEGVIDCTVFHVSAAASFVVRCCSLAEPEGHQGFPWADISITCTSVVVTTEDDAGLAERVGEEVGRWIWDNKQRFDVNEGDTKVFTAADAVQTALEHDGGPVVINETAVSRYDIAAIWVAFFSRS